ncbi:MAG: dienelactone hydrolase family protein [Bacteroidota bacterium]|jgi:carboxymethylenebutenolidase
MKYLFILTALCISPLSAQENESCCGPTATAEFASLGMNVLFAANHLAPEPFVYKTDGGSMMEIPAADKKNARIFEVPSKNPTKKFVFMIHEWWGLNDYIKQEAEHLQKELGDVTVIALDLYDGKVAADPKSAGEYMGAVKEQRVRTIINAAIAHAGKDAKVATIGWCFGGGWSLQASLQLKKQAAGCVMYYGMPEKDLKKLKTLNCDVLGIFAGQDQWINAKVVDAFKKNMKAAKKNLEVHVYDADHAFANPSNPKFDREKAGEAHTLALAFLKSRLQ